MSVIHTKPLHIYKAGIGLVGIWLAGMLAVLLLLGLGYLELQINPALSHLLAAVAFIAGIVTAIWSGVYGSSRMTLSPKELDVVNRASLFTAVIGTLEWNQVQDVEVRVSSFGSLFGYGTLIVHAANDQRDLVFTMTPRPNYWHAYMMQLAVNAVTDVHSE
jgi:hypothetical protein